MRNPYFKDILFEVETDVRGGESLSKALSKHEKAFSSFYINVIRSGEATGRLSEVLKYLADHAEREYVLHAKIKGAFTYPGFIFSAFLLVAVLMMVFVIPKLTIVLIESGQELPFFTRMLIGTSDLLRSWSWLIVIVIFVIGFGFVRFTKTDKGRKVWDKFKLRIPVLGKLSQKIYIARFSENFSTLLKGGLPILTALKISSQVIGNTVFSQLIEKAAEQIKGGGNISSVFEKSNEVPSLVVQMLKVGEKSAKLDTILERLAIFYQGEIDRMVNNLTQLIEPFMILILGAGVAFLVASILMPIYNISSGF
jgi:type IV pilus assembly protein PilC